MQADVSRLGNRSYKALALATLPPLHHIAPKRPSLAISAPVRVLHYLQSFPEIAYPRWPLRARPGLPWPCSRLLRLVHYIPIRRKLPYLNDEGSWGGG